MKDNLVMDPKMVREELFNLMEHILKENLFMIRDMDMGLKYGQMVNNMKGNFLMGLKKEKENLHGLMVMFMKETLGKIKWKELEFLNGKIKNMKENGRTVK
jgi:predicted nucleic-acid-binding protein